MVGSVRNKQATVATNEVLVAVQDILRALEQQMSDIDQATRTTNEMRHAMQQATDRAREQVSMVQNRTQDMFTTISQISMSVSGSGSKVQGVACAADLMSDSLGELNFAIANSQEGAQKLRLLVNQFQITDVRGGVRLT